MKWFNNLPWEWQVVLTILLIISVVVISIYGRLVFQKDKTQIGIGGSSSKDGKDRNERKHLCGECYMIIRNQIIETERKIKTTEASRMDRQMNFLDQKIEELQADLMDTYSDHISKIRLPDTAPGVGTIQFRLYEGILNDACAQVKREIRRALRENGYTGMTAPDYACYVKNEARTVMMAIYNHIRKLYPPMESNMIVPIGVVMGDIEASHQTIESLMFEFFNNAKDVNIQVDSEIHRLDKECDAICSQFVGVPVNMPTVSFKMP
jgi:hypothetical protein